MRSVAITAAAATLLAVGPTASGSAAIHPSPAKRLLAYAWAYNDGLLRPYVGSVTLTGGRIVVVNGRRRLTGATANVGETLHADPALTGAAAHICATVAAGVRALHLRQMIAAVQVWSVDGDRVARC